MNKINIIIFIVSILLTLIFSYFTSYIWMGIIPGIIIGFIKRRSTRLISGFLIGFLFSLLLYLAYPLNYLASLDKVIGNLAGLPGIILLIIYPLLYGLIELSSAGFIGEVLTLTRERKSIK